MQGRGDGKGAEGYGCNSNATYAIPMSDMNVQLSQLRKRQTELLTALDFAYDSDSIRELNIVNNKIEVTEKRIKGTYFTREAVTPMKIERDRR
jgi:hypothetical protein